MKNTDPVTEPRRRPQSTRWKRMVMIAAAAMLGLFAAYGAGRMQTRMRIGEVQRRSAEIVDGLQVELEGMRTRFEVADRERLQLEARRQLDLALSALDARNFGTAQTHLHEASEKLRKASQESAEAGKLSQDIEGVELTASENVSQQRGRVEELIARFDREIGANLTAVD